MRQVVVRRVGPPAEVAEVVEVERPRPLAGEVLVAVRAAPIHPIDLVRIRGMGLTVDPPFVPGSEAAGVVVEVGDGVSGVKVGESVVVPCGGTYGEIVACPADLAFPIPPGIDFQQASMLFTVPLTAALLLDLVELPQGTILIQNAAASAVGAFVVRLAKRKGLRSVNVVRRDAQATELEALGADWILVGDHDLESRVRYAVGGAPIRLGIDAVGGGSAYRLAQCLADGAHLVAHGSVGDNQLELPTERLVFGGIVARGFSLPRALATMSKAQQRRRYAELASFVASVGHRVPVEATYAFGKARDAFAHAERPSRTGKILFASP